MIFFGTLPRSRYRRLSFSDRFAYPCFSSRIRTTGHWAQRRSFLQHFFLTVTFLVFRVDGGTPPG